MNIILVNLSLKAYLILEVGGGSLLYEPGVELLLGVPGQGGVVEGAPALPVLTGQCPLTALANTEGQHDIMHGFEACQDSARSPPWYTQTLSTYVVSLRGRLENKQGLES